LGLTRTTQTTTRSALRRDGVFNIPRRPHRVEPCPGCCLPNGARVHRRRQRGIGGCPGGIVVAFESVALARRRKLTNSVRTNPPCTNIVTPRHAGPFAPAPCGIELRHTFYVSIREPCPRFKHSLTSGMGGVNNASGSWFVTRPDELIIGYGKRLLATQSGNGNPSTSIRPTMRPLISCRPAGTQEQTQSRQLSHENMVAKRGNN